MSEGRLTDVVLLDEQHLEILVQSKLFVYELIGLVASQCSLRREKNYFGLSYRDETGHYQWLQLDKHVLDHEFPKKTGTITLYFQVKFYIESILLLMERSTVVLFYLQSRQFLCKGLIETDSDTIFELSAYILQITHGDYVDDTSSRSNLKNFQLPRKILEENPSIAYCEDQIISFYKKLCGLTAGSALINYMSIVESLPTYGVHYYGVKDKAGIPWWVGAGVRGIAVFDHADKKIPRKFFPWRSLENLFFRDRKFTIEVSEPKSSSKKPSWNRKLNSSSSSSSSSSAVTTTSTATTTTAGDTSIVTHTWITPSTQLARSIWTMAVNQHQFYLDRKHLKGHSSYPWNVEDLRLELDNNCSGNTIIGTSSIKPPTSSDDPMNSSISAPNLTFNSGRDDPNRTLKSQSSNRDSETSKIYEDLKSRKTSLETKLKDRLQELKEICLKEAELTGSMPEDVQKYFKPEEIPQTRRRVGTAFALSSRFLDSDLSQADDLTQLEISHEIQEKMMNAAFMMAQDKTRSKTIRKKMRQEYQQKQIKLRELEVRMNELRTQRGQEEQLVHARSLEDVDDLMDLKTLIQRKPAFHSSLTDSHNEDPDKNSTYSSTSNKSSSSTTSISEQLHQQQQQQQQQPQLHQQQQILQLEESPASGIKFYPKKRLSETGHSRLHLTNSRSNRSNSCAPGSGPASDEHHVTPARQKSERRHNSGASVKSSGRIEGRRRSNHFGKNPTNSSSSSSSQSFAPCPASNRWITGAGDVASSAYSASSHLIGSLIGCPAVGSVEAVTPANEDSWKYKYNSLDRRRKSSHALQEKKDRADGGRRRGSAELPRLVPSKYGSKRDSTLEDDDDGDDDGEVEEEEEDYGDEDDVTLGRHEVSSVAATSTASLSSSATAVTGCRYLPNDPHFRHPFPADHAHFRAPAMDRGFRQVKRENSDSGSGNSSCVPREEDGLSSASGSSQHLSYSYSNNTSNNSNNFNNHHHPRHPQYHQQQQQHHPHHPHLYDHRQASKPSGPDDYCYHPRENRQVPLPLPLHFPSSSAYSLQRSDSASSGSSTSLHVQRPPTPSRLEFRRPTVPSGPDKLTRVFTDVRLVGPRPAHCDRQVARDQRNDEAVDALFRHYEEKILPSRMVSAKDAAVGVASVDDGLNQSSNGTLKSSKVGYLTSPNSVHKNRGTPLTSRRSAGFDPKKFLNNNNINNNNSSSKGLEVLSSTLPRRKKMTIKFCSTLV